MILLEEKHAIYLKDICFHENKNNCHINKNNCFISLISFLPAAVTYIKDFKKLNQNITQQLHFYQRQ